MERSRPDGRSNLRSSLRARRGTRIRGRHSQRFMIRIALLPARVRAWREGCERPRQSAKSLPIDVRRALHAQKGRVEAGRRTLVPSVRGPQINLIYAEICTATEHPAANFSRRNCVSYQPGRPMLRAASRPSLCRPQPDGCVSRSADDDR